MNRHLVLTAALAGCVSTAIAQNLPVPLNYNFNGVIHAGEAGNADDPNGFRSISDRALDFSGGVPNDSLLNGYQLVGTPLTLDCVHLGNRNTVSGNLFVFDSVPDGDDVASATSPARAAARRASPRGAARETAIQLARRRRNASVRNRRRERRSRNRRRASQARCRCC